MPLFALVSLLLVVQNAEPAASELAQVSHLPRVYVSTSEQGERTEVANRHQSVKDLRASLASKKKTLTLVVDEEGADITIEVTERTTTIPRVRIGLASPGAPVRAVHLRVNVTQGTDDPIEFTNKNTAYEDARGWQLAADDIAKQIEKWLQAKP